MRFGQTSAKRPDGPRHNCDLVVWLLRLAAAYKSGVPADVAYVVT
jgi:hypothetical protein